MEILYSKILNPDSASTPLLILHGLFGMSDNWNTIGKKLSENRPVHLIDLRNHGNSFWSDEMNMNVMSEDLYNYIVAHNLSNVDIMGHSLGGKVLMSFLNYYTEIVDKAIVVDIGVKAYPAHHQSIFKGFESLDFQIDKNRNLIDQTLSEYIPDFNIRQFLMKNIERDRENNYRIKPNLNIINKNYLSLLAEIEQSEIIDTPILFVKGENSNYIEDQDLITLEQLYSNMQIVEIKDAGHWVHAENPTDFFTVVNEFLK